MGDKLVQGVDAVFLPVSNLARSVDWYQATLGLDVLFREDQHGSAGMRAGDSGPTVCLVEVRDHRPVAFPENDFLTDIFFNYRVSDIETFHTHVAELGVEAGDIYTSLDGTFRCFAFDDPDGNRISIVN